MDKEKILTHYGIWISHGLKQAMDEYAREVAVNYTHNIIKTIFPFCVPELSEHPSDEDFKLFDEWIKNSTI